MAYTIMYLSRRNIEEKYISVTRIQASKGTTEMMMVARSIEMIVIEDTGKGAANVSQ